MIRFRTLVLVALAFLIVAATCSAQIPLAPKDSTLPEGIHAAPLPAEINTTITISDAVPVEGQMVGRPSILERRRMGFTIRNLVAKARELKDAGVLTEDTAPSEAAAMLMASVNAENPSNLQANIDWDAILDFIERLIPLIMQLISLFSGVPA